MRLKIGDTILNVCETGVENYGKQPSLVFLHYFGGSSKAWTEVIEQLAGNFHCVAPDMRGFGASSAEPENFTVENYADDAANLISTLRLENFLLIGHSMGGKIALALAARNPLGLRSMVLLAPSPPTPEPMKESERKKMLAAHGNRCAATETVCKAAGGKLSGAVFERSINDNLRSSEAAWRAWLESGSLEDISAETEKISVPVLIAAGENDEAMTPELLKKEVSSRIKNSELKILPSAGHLLPLETPAAIAELIRQFCKNNREN